MKPIEIANGIFSVGVTDWNIRDFHGYSTDTGTSYNAFLILDEKIALVDTVKKEFADKLMENISRVVDPGKIDCVISNHTEMDHSGSLPRVMHRIGEDTPLYCSKMAFKNHSLHFSQNWNYQVVRSGDTLNLGKRTLTFLETRMVHWPDSMFTYLAGENILFASDGFGQHYAGHETFDDEVGDRIMPYAKKYFANILLLYAPLILKLLAKVTELGLQIDMICPDHGILWRENPEKIIELYAGWSRQTPLKKAVVIYDTMWESTRKMAEAISSGCYASGVPCQPMHLRKWHRSDIMTEILDAGAIIVGSPTLNNGIYPTVSDFLTYMKGLKPRHKVGAAFGSYGWSGEAVNIINGKLEEAGVDVVDPGLRVQFVPDSSSMDDSYHLGNRIGQLLGERLAHSSQ